MSHQLPVFKNIKIPKKPKIKVTTPFDTKKNVVKLLVSIAKNNIIARQNIEIASYEQKGTNGCSRTD